MKRTAPEVVCSKRWPLGLVGVEPRVQIEVEIGVEIAIQIGGDNSGVASGEAGGSWAERDQLGPGAEPIAPELHDVRRPLAVPLPDLSTALSSHAVTPPDHMSFRPPHTLL